MRMTALALPVILFVNPLRVFADEVTIKVDAPIAEALKLVEHLNQNGSKQQLRFRLTEDERRYDYRIAVASEGGTATDVLFNSWGGADASAAVLSPDCRLLFIVSRGGRLSQAGAMNAVAKELVKKFVAYRHATAGSLK